jgi:hypothetical protein
MGIQVHVFGRPVRMPYCSDMHAGAPPEEQIWRAVAGAITIERPRVHSSSRPRVIIRLEGAVFLSPSGERVAHPAPIVLAAVMSTSQPD